MRQRLEVSYPMLPPSSNKIYFKGTMLRAESRKYAEDFSKFMMQRHGSEILEMDKNSIYALHLRFYFEKLENAKWNDLKVPLSKRPKSRYRRIDLDNRIKLLQDCIRDAIDVEDSQIFAASQEKHQDPGNERVEIIIQSLSDRKQFGLRDT